VADVETSLSDMRKQISLMQKDFGIDNNLRDRIDATAKKEGQTEKGT